MSVNETFSTSICPEVFRMLRVLVAFAMAMASVLMSPMDVGQKTLPKSEWPLLGGNGEQWQYSPLDQINDRNVGRLVLAWYADMPVAEGLVGNPLVMGGVVYQGAPGGKIVANDVRTGKQL